MLGWKHSAVARYLQPTHIWGSSPYTTSAANQADFRQIIQYATLIRYQSVTYTIVYHNEKLLYSRVATLNVFISDYSL